MKTRISALAVIATVALGFPALAQAEDSPCGVTQTASLDAFAELLEGGWTTDFMAGYAMAGSMILPHPAAPAPETGHFEFSDGRLTLVPDAPGGISMAFDWETGVDWSFDHQPSVSGITTSDLPEMSVNDEELSIIAGCDVNDLPRLVGASSVEMDGVSMTFVLRLVVVNPDLIYGFQQVHGIVRGQPVLERRPFVMSRNS